MTNHFWFMFTLQNAHILIELCEHVSFQTQIRTNNFGQIIARNQSSLPVSTQPYSMLLLHCGRAWHTARFSLSTLNEFLFVSHVCLGWNGPLWMFSFVYKGKVALAILIAKLNPFWAVALEHRTRSVFDYVPLNHITFICWFCVCSGWCLAQ